MIHGLLAFSHQKVNVTKDSIMPTDSSRAFLLPSALILSGLLADHAGEPTFEALEQAGFQRHEIGSYLERRASKARSSKQTKNC